MQLVRMHAEQFMSSPPVSTEVDCTIHNVARMMRKERIGFLPIVSGHELVGVITDRDLVLRVLASTNFTLDACISNVMSQPVQTCDTVTPIESVAAIMGDNQIRRLPVMEHGVGLVGVISVDDIAEHASEHLAGETLGEIVEKR